MTINIGKATTKIPTFLNSYITLRQVQPLGKHLRTMRQLLKAMVQFVRNTGTFAYSAPPQSYVSGQAPRQQVSIRQLTNLDMQQKALKVPQLYLFRTLTPFQPLTHFSVGVSTPRQGRKRETFYIPRKRRTLPWEVPLSQVLKMGTIRHRLVSTQRHQRGAALQPKPKTQAQTPASATLGAKARTLIAGPLAAMIQPRRKKNSSGRVIDQKSRGMITWLTCPWQKLFTFVGWIGKRSILATTINNGMQQCMVSFSVYFRRKVEWLELKCVIKGL